MRKPNLGMLRVWIVALLNIAMKRTGSPMRFVVDKRGATPATVKAGIIIGISLFVVAVVFPLAMTQVVDANTTGWNAGVTTLFTVLLPVLGIVGIALKYL